MIGFALPSKKTHSRNSLLTHSFRSVFFLCIGLLHSAFAFGVQVPDVKIPGSGQGSGQGSGDDRVESRPIRRIFVPRSELPELTLDRMRPIELDLLAPLLERLSEGGAAATGNKEVVGTSAIQSLHAFARLVGRDFVSDRTRLRFHEESSRIGPVIPRRRLTPWNLAIDDIYELSAGGTRLNNQNATSPGIVREGRGKEDGNAVTSKSSLWVHDESGVPWVDASKPELWTDWSLRPESEAGPNQLRYRLRVPRSVDGCLVLQLPKRAKVESAEVATVKFNDWNDVLSRLDNWPDRNPVYTNPTPSGVDAAFWGIELSGRSEISLTVDLGSSELRSIVASPSEQWGVDRLITKQAIQYSLGGGDLRIQYEWEWTEPRGEFAPFRLEMPEGYKLRALSLNDREVAVEVDRNRLEIGIPQAVERVSSQKVKMSAEFLYRLPKVDLQSEGTIRVPPVLNRNGYVLAGTTILQDGARSEFLAVRPAQGRLESARRNSEGTQRLEYSWFQQPPWMEFQWRERVRTNRYESMTRIATEAGRVQAFVRLRAYFEPHSPVCFLNLPEGWVFDSQSLVLKPPRFANDKRVFVESNGVANNTGETNVTNSPKQLRIEHPGSANGEVNLEFRLFRALPAGETLRLAQEPWIEIPGWDSNDVVVVESTGSKSLEIDGPIRSWLFAEEDLSSWEKEFLPRIGKYVLLRVDQRRLPPLIVRPDVALQSLNFESLVRRAGNDFCVEHRFVLTDIPQKPSELLIQLPSSFTWFLETEKGAFPVDATFDAARQEWNLQLNAWRDSQNFAPKSLLAREYRKAPQKNTTTGASAESTWDLIPPKVKDFSTSRWTIDLKGSLSLAIPAEIAHTRAEIFNGVRYVLQAQNSGPYQVGQASHDAAGASRIDYASASGVSVGPVQVVDSGQRGESSTFFRESQMYLVVDASGNQSLLIDAVLLRVGAERQSLRWKVPDGWRGGGAQLLSEKRPTESLSVEYDRERNQVSVNLPVGGGSENNRLRLRLIGPNLSERKLEQRAIDNRRWDLNKFLPAAWFPTLFQEVIIGWPEVGFLSSQPINPQRFLVYPTGVSLNVPAVPNVQDSQSSILPFANWFHSAIAPWSLREFQWNEGRDLSEANETGLWNRIAWESSWDRASSSPVLSNRTWQTIAVWVAVLAVFFSAGLFHRWSWMIVGLAVLLAVSIPWIPSPFVVFSQFTILGLGIGALLQRTSRLALDSTFQVPSRGTVDRWRSWNLQDDDPHGTEELGVLSGGKEGRGTGTSTPILMLWTVLGAGCFYGSDGRVGQAQDLFSGGPKVFDVLIPVDEEGKVAGTTVYVPVELLEWADQRDKLERQQLGLSSVLSSKHTIKLDGRSIGFAMADPLITSTYEIEVGEFAIGKPIRIPYPIDTLKLSRFTVDGLEVLSGRLSRNDTDLTWFPERSGKRVLQLEGSTRLAVLDGSNRETSGQRVPGVVTDKQKGAWLVDLPILPACNALLDLETDGNWASEVDAFGRSMNPSTGKTIVQLGNKSRLRVELQMQPSIGNRSTPLAMPGELTSTASDQPTMNTELLIDREQLLARTVVDFPRGSLLGNEIEIEADAQWAPIGSQWGDAQLIEIKTGSTLDRNRFVLRWRANEEEANQSTEGVNRRSIITTWIPVGDSPLRSVLFAECRDRRVRQGTLRYSRAAGSLWSLDSISSWIPAINAKDRLDWPELREFPLTTNLRIPINSGFGVLRRQALLRDKNLSLDCSLHFGQRFGTAVWRVQARGPIGNQDTLLFSLPAPIRVEQVSGSNGPLEFKSWSQGELNYTQVLIDRSSESTSEFRISGSYPLQVLQENGPLFAMPELKMIGWSSDEGRVSITADPQWKLRILGDDASEDMLVGKGVLQILWTGLLVDTAVRSLSLQSAEKRWEGAVVLQSKSEIDEFGEVYWVTRVLGVRKTTSSDFWNALELSLPKDFGTDIESSNPYRELSALQWDQRVFRVEPTTDATSGDASRESDVEYVVDFSFDIRKDSPQDPLQIFEGSASRIAVEGKFVPVWIVRSLGKTTKIDNSQPEETVVEDPNPNEVVSPAVPSATAQVQADPLLTEFVFKTVGLQMATHQLVAANSSRTLEVDDGDRTSKGLRCLLANHHRSSKTVYSEFWLMQDAGQVLSSEVRFELPTHAQCLWACINGRSVSFDQQQSNLLVNISNPSDAHYVEIWVKEQNSTRLGTPFVVFEQPGDYPSLVHEENADKDIASEDIASETIAVRAGSAVDESARQQAIFQVLGIWKKWLALPSVAGRSDGMNAFAARRASRLLHEAMQFNTSSAEQRQEIDFAEWGGLLKSLLPPDQLLDIKEFDGASNILGVGAPIGKTSTWKTRGDNARKAKLQGDSGVWTDATIATLPSWARFLLPLMLCGAYLLVYAMSFRQLQQHPWWELLLLGAGWFAWTGSIWILLILAFFAALLVCDTYWLISVRSRQSVLRGPR
jgi:hypothetical protein